MFKGLTQGIRRINEDIMILQISEWHELLGCTNIYSNYISFNIIEII